LTPLDPKPYVLQKTHQRCGTLWPLTATWIDQYRSAVHRCLRYRNILTYLLTVIMLMQMTTTVLAIHA